MVIHTHTLYIERYNIFQAALHHITGKQLAHLLIFIHL